MQSRAINVFLFIISGIPLLAYPLVLMANIMQLAGARTDEDALLYFIVYGFILLSSTYVVTYVASLIAHLVRKKRSKFVVLLPYFHLLAVVIIFMVWLNYE
jgi:hypothetical protein